MLCQSQVAPCQEPPDQLLPLQVLPDQLLPLHVLPDHVEPDHVEPLHVLPDQVEPDQVEPLQVEPDHVDPFQVPPDQLFPAASAWATVAELNGLPKTSFSPVSTTPSRVMWSVPRASSSEPLPVASVNFCP